MSRNKDLSEKKPGKVYLVGAGPGDPTLITVKGLNILIGDVPGIQLAIHAGLTPATGDKLGVLGAKIADQDTLGMDICGHYGIAGAVKKGE